MNAKKRAEESGGVAVARSPKPQAGGTGKWIALGAVIAAIFATAAVVVWRQVREHVTAGSEYKVDPREIAVTPPPEWIKSDVKAEVIHEASFDGPLSLLDSELTVRMASAFAAHPWVAHVERVSKRFPSSLEIVVTYRKPVAMVEVPGGALPVDADGVVLPSADFAKAEAERYPRIGEIHTTHTGPVGTRWSDAAVTGAAQVAGVLVDDWQKLGLARIVPAGRKPARTGFEYEFTLLTRGGTRIDWGRPPGSDTPGELPAADRIARLREYVANNGSLDGDGGPQHLRFLESGRLEAQRRPPVKALPKTSAGR